MGQKINPISFRLQIQDTWRSRWFAERKTYREFLAQDIKLRKMLMQKLKPAGIAKVDIERSLKSLRIIIFVTRPGLVIGRGGGGLEEIKLSIIKVLESGTLNKQMPKIDIRVEEIKNPDLSAYLIASKVAEQLERRMPQRRVVTKTMEKVMQSGARGVKITLSGRINGAEISRREKYFQGSIPLQTLRANIDYAQTPSYTRSGFIGVKVWIHKPAHN